ncbi:cytochrome c oxidase assembly protein COX16 homolog, mitochondrial [Palaemon carinicauda]|uniref:cytochrome c oxidase assembly protein COX16 homolog, mitochondrial n=1 Tax=Palaemon carinicauda TaxID=392227 RepID=UPI0035B57938
MAGGFLQNRSVKVGIPFLLLIVGGSFGLKEFAQLRYDFRNRRSVTKDMADKLGVPMKEPENVTLEAVYSGVSQLDTTNWENKRGPRPWEENNELYSEAIERGKALNKGTS